MKQNFRAGVIEGFFGRSWSWQSRSDYAQFLRQTGYDFYIYAPKSDSFLRRRWREPIPADLQQQLTDLAGRYRNAGLSFGIGLTPYEIYREYDANARSQLLAKVRQIDEIGVDTLCILFDDMRGDFEGLAQWQATVVDDVCAASKAQHFIVCPTYYSYDPLLAKVFGAPPTDYLQTLGRLLDARIDVFWTGEKVISSGYSAAHLESVASQIGRKPFIWDNHIANDGRARTDFLYLDPAASGWHMARDHAAGLAINPMNQPYLSRIALAGYMRLLSQSTQDFSQICTQLCRPPVAERLIAGIDAMQTVGLTRFDPDSRRDLLDWYEAQPDDPYATEVSAWLRGEYVFDPQCLTA